MIRKQIEYLRFTHRQDTGITLNLYQIADRLGLDRISVVRAMKGIWPDETKKYYKQGLTVYQNVVITYINRGCGSVDDICKATGYSYKRVNNALVGLKNKGFDNLPEKKEIARYQIRREILRSRTIEYEKTGRYPSVERLADITGYGKEEVKLCLRK